MLVILDMLVSSAITLLIFTFGFTLSKVLFKKEKSVFYHIIAGLTLATSILIYPSLIIGIFSNLMNLFFAIITFTFITWIAYFILKKTSAHIITPVKEAMRVEAKIVEVKKKTPASGRVPRFPARFSLTSFFVLSMFFLVFFLRPLLLLVRQGSFTWDAFDIYLPNAKTFHELGHMPFADPKRPGFIIARPPLIMILYSFCFFFSPPPSESMITACLLFALGLGAIAADIIYKRRKSFRLALLAMGITISMPLYDFYYFHFGTMTDLPFSFFFLASIYFLIRIFAEEKDIPENVHYHRFLFWSTLSLALLTKDTAIPYSLAYLIVFAFYCKERVETLFIANGLIAARIILGLLSIVPFYWISPRYVIFEFLLLFFLQLSIILSSNPAKNSFVELLKSIKDKACLLIFFPSLWILRNFIYTGNPFPMTLSFNKLILYGAPIGLLLLSFGIFLHPFKENTLKKIKPFIWFFVLVFFAIDVFYFFTSPPLSPFGESGYEIAFVPLGTLIFLFLSNWLGSLYIIPKILGFFSTLKGDRDTDKMLLCVMLLMLGIWYSEGCASERYILQLVPLVSVLIIIGLSEIKSHLSGQELSLFMFSTLLCVVFIFSSFNYQNPPYGFLDVNVHFFDIIRNELLLPISIVISAVFTSIIYLILSLHGARALILSLKVRRKKIKLRLRFLGEKIAFPLRKTVTVLWIIILSLPIIIPQISIIGSLQKQRDYAMDNMNMGYLQLLDDLSTNFGDPDATILTFLESGTTYWSNLNVIDLSEGKALLPRDIFEIASSKNLSRIFDFYRTYNIKFIILPKKMNWYWHHFVKRFLDETFCPWEFPKIRNLLKSLNYGYFIHIYRNWSEGDFRYVNPYDYYDVYYLPHPEKLPIEEAKYGGLLDLIVKPSNLSVFTIPTLVGTPLLEKQPFGLLFIFSQALWSNVTIKITLESQGPESSSITSIVKTYDKRDQVFIDLSEYVSKDTDIYFHEIILTFESKNNVKTILHLNTPSPLRPPMVTDIIANGGFEIFEITKVIIDDNQTNFWETRNWGNGTVGVPILSSDTSKNLSGSDCLKITVGNGPYAGWNIFHIYESAQNWTNQDFLSFYLYGENRNETVCVRIRAPDFDNRFSNHFREDFTGWKLITLPLSEFGSEAGTPSWGNVKEIYIEFYGNVSGVWYVDHLFFGKGGFAGWQNTGGWELVNDESKEGNYSVHATVKDQNLWLVRAPDPESVPPERAQTLPIGTKVIFQGWVKTELTQGYSALEIKKIDLKTGKAIFLRYPQEVKGTTDWTKLSAIDVVDEPYTAYSFRCFIHNGIGEVWFDDIQCLVVPHGSFTAKYEV